MLRPSKFPEIEAELVKWLFECKDRRVVLSDCLIRSKAREVARQMEISDDKFKASSGWVENFKNRHGIRKGVWEGNGRNAQVIRAQGGSALHEDEDAEPRPTLADYIYQHNLYDLDETLKPVRRSHKHSVPSGVPAESRVRENDSENPETDAIGANLGSHQDIDEAQQAMEATTQSLGHIHSPEHIQSPVVENPSTAQAHLDVDNSFSSVSTHLSDSLSHSQHMESPQVHVSTSSPAILSRFPDSSDVSMHIESSAQAAQTSPLQYFDMYPPPPVPQLSIPEYADTLGSLDKVMRFVDAQPQGFLRQDDHQALTRIKLAVLAMGSRGGPPPDLEAPQEL